MGSRKLNINLIVALSTALFLVMAFCSLGQAESAAPSPHKKMMSEKTAGHCAEMKQHHEKMMEEMKAQDAEVDALVVKMNSAPPDKKVEIMADIITRMSRQRSAMHTKMDEMKSNMMEHKHMGKGGMSDCPMMKDM